MTEVAKAVAQAVSETVASPTVAADQSAVPAITQAVMEEVQPRIDHLTNRQPIWQSQTFWGLVFLIGTRELALRGYALPDEMHGPVLDLVISYGPYLAALIIAYGRWFARKPLFSRWFKRRATT